MICSLAQFIETCLLDVYQYRDRTDGRDTFPWKPK